VDKDDIGPGQKSGEAGDQFGPDGGVVVAELKEAFQHGSLRSGMLNASL
jgi:hypothetical protein